MKPWDIYTYDFGEAKPHPAVIVSHPDRVKLESPQFQVLSMQPSDLLLTGSMEKSERSGSAQERG